MKSRTRWGLVYQFEYLEKGQLIRRSPPIHNLVPQQGVDHIAGLIDGSVPLIGDWFIGLYAGNYVPTMSTTAADLATNVGEFTGYSAAERLPWNRSFDGVSDLSNAANMAEFQITTDSLIYGGFIVSAAPKNSGSGKLLSIVRNPSPEQVRAGGTLRVLAGLMITSI